MITSTRYLPINWTRGAVDVRTGADRTFGLTVDGGPDLDCGRATAGRFERQITAADRGPRSRQ
jgi:hypothetical protein